MLNDRQSLILCGIIAGGFFVSGVLEILDNYIVKTVLTILFLVLIINFFVVYSKSKKEKQNDLK
ncbi:hypothetical protein EV196_107190 [Mariniflexile fucanivorans]|uniref:Uncharacterized protein n=1 Tax=Mariniflexile fucanivorans TaxID=264023 RepID=A0A4R1RFW9_9FLAO|nr:hypothetical protein [Mariniflexile fucanivorans]TCL64482.1 hypothetical protein EV196_107190 [Mariniflexile fucanivorans]